MIQIHKILNWLIVKIKQIFMKLYSLKQQNNYPHNDHNDNEFNKNEIVKKKKQNKRKKKQNQIGDIDLINNTTEIIIENEQGEIKKDKHFKSEKRTEYTLSGMSNIDRKRR